MPHALFGGTQGPDRRAGNGEAISRAKTSRSSPSIDPSEDAGARRVEEGEYVKCYGQPESAPGWHFLTGQQPAIDAVADATGFGYVRMPGPDGKMNQFAHASAIQIVTPEGKIAQYYMGVEYSPQDLRLGLIEASNHKIGTPVDTILTYCYRYDPTLNRHSLARRAHRAGGVASYSFDFGQFHGGDVPPGYQEQPGDRTPATFSEGVSQAGHGRFRKRNAGKGNDAFFQSSPLAIFSEVAHRVRAVSAAGFGDCALYGRLLLLPGADLAGGSGAGRAHGGHLLHHVPQGKEPAATHIEGSTLLEATWTIIPLALFMVCFVWGALLYFRIYNPPTNAMNIYIVGKQWMWKAEHPGGQHEINALHVPVNRDVQLTMISQDVFHSFSIPAFRVKREVIPGRYSTVWFQATQAGTYHLFCTQYCGTLHSSMIGDIVVMSPDDYQKWTAGSTSGHRWRRTARSSLRQPGLQSCHSGTAGARGPNLAGIYGAR